MAVTTLDEYRTIWQAHKLHNAGKGVSMALCPNRACREAAEFEKSQEQTVAFAMALAGLVTVQDGITQAMQDVQAVTIPEGQVALRVEVSMSTQEAVEGFITANAEGLNEDLDAFLQRALLLRRFFNWLVQETNVLDLEQMGETAQHLYKLERKMVKLRALVAADLPWFNGTARTELNLILKGVTPLTAPASMLVPGASVNGEPLKEPIIIGDCHQ